MSSVFESLIKFTNSVLSGGKTALLLHPLPPLSPLLSEEVVSAGEKVQT